MGTEADYLIDQHFDRKHGEYGDPLPHVRVEAVDSASDVSTKYHELLYAVERCFPGESRHETALRYIRETERRVSEVGSCKQNNRVSGPQPAQETP